VTEKLDKTKENMAQLAKKNRRLKKELARKEKALAEMAAIMILKIFDAICEGNRHCA
jgi:hypothetical protein